MKPWSTSDRRQRLPRNWAKLRDAVKHRADGMCQAKQHDPRCDGIGAECDHVIAGDDHRMSNLQWLSVPCHLAKTLREAQAPRAVYRRSQEGHPGLI